MYSTWTWTASSMMLHTSSQSGDRLPDDEYSAWALKDFRAFVEQRCGLSRRHKTVGAVFEDHSEAYYYWYGLVEEGCLETPFELVHVDGHSDLGLSDAGWKYISRSLLHRDIPDRPYRSVISGFLNSCNFVAFALACRWVTKLTFVHNDHWHHDLMPLYFKDIDTDCGVLQLKAYGDIGDGSSIYKLPSPIAFEPEIPFLRCKATDYFSNCRFDIATICRSTNYTPKGADVLLEAFREYVDES